MLPVLLPSSELCSESKITATWRVPRSLLLVTPRWGGAIGVVEFGVDLGFGRGADKKVGVDLFRAGVAVDAIFLAAAGVDTAVAVGAVVDDADAVEVGAIFAAVDGAIAVAAVDALFVAGGAAVSTVDVDAILTAVDGAIAVAAVDAILAAGGAAVGAVDVDAGASVARNVASVGRSVPRLSTRKRRLPKVIHVLCCSSAYTGRSAGECWTNSRKPV